MAAKDEQNNKLVTSSKEKDDQEEKEESVKLLTENAIRSGLKLKRGNLFKQKKRIDPRAIDLTIKKEGHGPHKTKAELAFLKRQEETAFERLSKRAAISHREKVEVFNKQMEELTEFNDIPKVFF
uniref:Protein FAM32A-like n=1 Tax=Meloidogyne hapla TaxID=6305 RepID=A0A1I8B162_MELHA